MQNTASGCFPAPWRARWPSEPRSPCGLWHSWRAAVVADGREELREERVAVVVQLLHLGRQLGVLLGVVQLHLLHDEVVPGLEQLVGQVQFLLVLRRNQAVKLLVQFGMHRAGMHRDASVHPHVAG